LLGLVGVGVLIDPLAILATYAVDVFVASMVLLGALAWSVGSLYGRRVDLPANPFMSTALQMVGGGACLVLAGLLLGEGDNFNVMSISLLSFAGWSYLVFFGAILAFSAYVWLLRNTSPAQATTYAYVNPIVAVFLGWGLMNEPLNARILLAVALLVTAVVLINRYGHPARSKKTAETPSPHPTVRSRTILPRRPRASRPVLPRQD
jgi:drug/metabolite transporter (DMT)-like permease